MNTKTTILSLNWNLHIRFFFLSYFIHRSANSQTSEYREYPV
jgi:hypothetical protein